MDFLKKIFRKKEKPIRSYADFWEWFKGHEQVFYEVVKSREQIEERFFDKISPKLDELKEGFFYVTGMCDEDTAELIVTVGGCVENVVFVEELVAAAPELPRWRFTALKPASDIQDVAINMAGYQFGQANLSFYAQEHSEYPDEVDIVVVYDDYREEDRARITNGVFLFLDNYLGELNVLTAIDNVTVVPRGLAEQALIPIEKLKDYLVWREKEFVEKYSGLRYDTENDIYSTLEAELPNELPWVALVNSTLLAWDGTASHPWILKVEIEYGGHEHHGMPDSDTYRLLNDFEDEVLLRLKDVGGCLPVGRTTANGLRVIFFACQDFRKPSKILYGLILQYADRLDATYFLYKDKYWQSFEKLRP